MSDKQDWSAMLDALADIVAETGGEGWLVGGCLRDALLGEPIRDVDVAITVDPLSVAEPLAQRLGLAVARLGHGTIRLSMRDTPATYLDLTPLQGGSIAADLARRDFTVNAMALPLVHRAEWLAIVRGKGDSMPSLIDPYGGREHVRARLLIAVGPDTFRRDPGRIVRAARMRARFGLIPDAEMLQLARASAPMLSSLPFARLRDEFDLLLALPSATDGIALLDEVGALATQFPGLTSIHALATLRQLDRLMGIVGGGKTFPSLQAWSASGARRSAIRLMALYHADDDHEQRPTLSTLWTRELATLRIEDETKRFHFARMLFDGLGKGEAAAADGLLVAVACALAYGLHDAEVLAERADALVRIYLTDREALIPPPLLRGKDLLEAFAISPGPEIGRILRKVRLAQLVGEIGDREEALALASRLAETHSAEPPSE